MTLGKFLRLTGPHSATEKMYVKGTYLFSLGGNYRFYNVQNIVLDLEVLYNKCWLLFS